MMPAHERAVAIIDWVNITLTRNTDYIIPQSPLTPSSAFVVKDLITLKNKSVGQLWVKGRHQGVHRAVMSG